MALHSAEPTNKQGHAYRPPPDFKALQAKERERIRKFRSRHIKQTTKPKPFSFSTSHRPPRKSDNSIPLRVDRQPDRHPNLKLHDPKNPRTLLIGQCDQEVGMDEKRVAYPLHTESSDSPNIKSEDAMIGSNEIDLGKVDAHASTAINRHHVDSNQSLSRSCCYSDSNCNDRLYLSHNSDLDRCGLNQSMKDAQDYSANEQLPSLPLADIDIDTNHLPISDNSNMTNGCQGEEGLGGNSTNNSPPRIPSRPIKVDSGGSITKIVAEMDEIFKELRDSHTTPTKMNPVNSLVFTTKETMALVGPNGRAFPPNNTDNQPMELSETFNGELQDIVNVSKRPNEERLEGSSLRERVVMSYCLKDENLLEQSDLTTLSTPSLVDSASGPTPEIPCKLDASTDQSSTVSTTKFPILPAVVHPQKTIDLPCTPNHGTSKLFKETQLCTSISNCSSNQMYDLEPINIAIKEVGHRPPIESIARPTLNLYKASMLNKKKELSKETTESVPITHTINDHVTIEDEPIVTGTSLKNPIIKPEAANDPIGSRVHDIIKPTAVKEVEEDKGQTTVDLQTIIQKTVEATVEHTLRKMKCTASSQPVSASCSNLNTGLERESLAHTAIKKTPQPEMVTSTTFTDPNLEMFWPSSSFQFSKPDSDQSEFTLPAHKRVTLSSADFSRSHYTNELPRSTRRDTLGGSYQPISGGSGGLYSERKPLAERVHPFKLANQISHPRLQHDEGACVTTDSLRLAPPGGGSYILPRKPNFNSRLSLSGSVYTPSSCRPIKPRVQGGFITNITTVQEEECEGHNEGSQVQPECCSGHRQPIGLSNEMHDNNRNYSNVTPIREIGSGLEADQSVISKPSDSVRGTNGPSTPRRIAQRLAYDRPIGPKPPTTPKRTPMRLANPFLPLGPRRDLTTHITLMPTTPSRHTTNHRQSLGWNDMNYPTPDNRRLSLAPCNFNAPDPINNHHNLLEPTNRRLSMVPPNLHQSNTMAPLTSSLSAYKFKALEPTKCRLSLAPPTVGPIRPETKKRLSLAPPRALPY